MSPAHGTLCFSAPDIAAPLDIAPASHLSPIARLDLACARPRCCMRLAAENVRLCSAGVPVRTAISPTTTRAGDDATTNPNLRLSEVLTSGSLLLEVRPRFNLITETAKAKDDGGHHRARARRLAFGTGTRPSAHCPGDSHWHRRPHRLNDDPRRFASSPFPLLPDPARQSVNQLHLDYSGFRRHESSRRPPDPQTGRRAFHQ